MTPSISLSMTDRGFDEAIDHPEALAEMQAAFQRYETALMENDVAVLDELFLNSPHTVRYGPAENLYGFEEIARYRTGRNVTNIARKLVRVAITTYGRNMAVANCEYERLSDGRRGRQSQTWLRFPDGWRVVSAHVSLLPSPT
jgi:hypothetical protein